MNVFSVPFTGDGFQVGDRMIPATLALRRALKGQLQSGQRFDFGIRPEHVRLEPSLPHVRGTVARVVPWGSDWWVQVMVPAANLEVPIGMILSGCEPPLVGVEVPLAFDLREMVLFDPATGDRIFPTFSTASEPSS